MTSHLASFLLGAFCSYFVYCFFVYPVNMEGNKKKTEIQKDKPSQLKEEMEYKKGDIFYEKNDPWCFVRIIDKRHGYVRLEKYTDVYGTKRWLADPFPEKLDIFEKRYSKCDDQNINIGSQS